MASVLVEKVKALAEQMGTVQVSVSTTQSQPQIQRLPGETDAQYKARVAREEAVRRAAAAARAATVAATPATTETVYLDADERTNRLLMVGKQDQLATIDKLVDSLDVQQQDLRSLRLYRILHVDAEDARKKLEALNIIPPQPQTSTVSTRLTATQPSTAAAGQQPRPTPQSILSPEATPTASPVEAPQVVVVEATNSLLVNATAEQHQKISEVLSHIDTETLESAMPFEIYPLENQSPERMAEILNKIIAEKIQDKEAKIEQVVRKIEDLITVVPDPNTYSLIVHASPKNQQWIGRLIKSLDKRRPQVLIDVTLVEVSKTEDFNYDLSLIGSLPNLDKASGLVGANGIIPGTLREGNVLQTTAGALTGFYGDAHINALLTAMQNKKYGRVLAKPKVLVNDHAKGTIKTTDTTYVLTKQSSLPTQGAQLVQTAEQYVPYDAGITLEITPHISEGDLLQLNIKLTRSDFTTTPTGNQPPDKSQSDIDTVVTVPNGSTIILGGLLKLNQTKGGAKVPLLGDLPLIGAAFRSIGNSDIEKKLYVFVKAEIIRPADVVAGEDSLRKLSERYRSAFERHEQEFQEYQSIPGIKSVPMNPERVLDAQ
jgi:type II secretory pathway component GspD/PulD (secretin)